MSGAHQKYLCDAVASLKNETLFITVFRVNDGMEFESGHGDIKYASPRLGWTRELLKYEIGHAFGARSVEIVGLPEQALPNVLSTKARLNPASDLPSTRPARNPARPHHPISGTRPYAPRNSGSP